MLKRVRKGRAPRAVGRMAIVAAEFNARYVDAMLEAALGEWRQAGAREVEVIRVPGAYEIPVVAGSLARSGQFEAVLCLGVIFRGETTHAQHIGEAVSQALAWAQVAWGVPLIHGVYLFENEAQARVRCLDPGHNRGIELASTALAMVRIMRGLPVDPTCTAPGGRSAAIPKPGSWHSPLPETASRPLGSSERNRSLPSKRVMTQARRSP